ncbi:MAG: hypothetical protein JW757_13605 [Anaerolineales bacterium]|nr:hypothetical protein [Anaerolineales bacterium]
MNDDNERNHNGFDRKFEWNSADNNWIMGIVLIVVGGLFLLDSFNILDIRMTNWWAVFLLIPGLSMAVNGWRGYQETQSVSARNSGMWGLILIMIAFSFFFNISWNLIFPVVLIGVGAYLLFFR